MLIRKTRYGLAHFSRDDFLDASHWRGQDRTTVHQFIGQSSALLTNVIDFQYVASLNFGLFFTPVKMYGRGGRNV